MPFNVRLCFIVWIIFVLGSCSKEPLFENCSFSERESTFLKDSILPTSIGTIYYIDSEGGTSLNNGLTEEEPLSSLSDVNTLSLNPGDQVLFSRGQCFNGSLTIEVSGSEENPIIFGAYGIGDRPQFFSRDGSIQVTKVKTFSLFEADHITLQNLDIQGGENAIFISNSSHVIIEGCRIGLHSEAGIVATGEHSEGSGSNHGIVRECLIDSGRSGNYGDLQSTDGIRLVDGASNWTIRSNEIRAWAHSGVLIKQVENLMDNNGNLIEGNLFTCGDIDYMRALDITGGDQLTQDNVFYANIIRDQSVTSHLHGNDNLVAYNLFLGLSESDASDQPWAIDFHVITNRLGTPERKELVCYNNKVYNNLFYNYLGGSGVAMLNRKNGAEFDVQNNEVVNNIFYDVTFPLEIENEPTSIKVENNLFFNREDEVQFLWEGDLINLADLQGLTGERGFSIKNNLMDDPSFQNPDMDNFNLLGFSQAIDNGLQVGLVKDFSGKVIENRVDIGPLEF